MTDYIKFSCAELRLPGVEVRCPAAVEFKNPVTSNTQASKPRALNFESFPPSLKQISAPTFMAVGDAGPSARGTLRNTSSVNTGAMAPFTPGYDSGSALAHSSMFQVNSQQLAAIAQSGLGMLPSSATIREYAPPIARFVAGQLAMPGIGLVPSLF